MPHLTAHPINHTTPTPTSPHRRRRTPSPPLCARISPAPPTRYAPSAAVPPKLPFLPLRLRLLLLQQIQLCFYRYLLTTTTFTALYSTVSASCTALLLYRPACLIRPAVLRLLPHSTLHSAAQPSPAQHCDSPPPPPTPHYCTREDSCTSARNSPARQATAHLQPLYRPTCYTGCLVLCVARLRSSTLSAVRSRAGANPLVIAGRFLLPQITYLPSSPYPAGPARQPWYNLTSRDGHVARSPQCLAQCSLSSPDTYCPGRQP